MSLSGGSAENQNFQTCYGVIKVKHNYFTVCDLIQDYVILPFQTANLKLINEEVKDGEKLKPTVKELGHSETFPQSVKFSPTGRYFAICGDNDFVVY